MSDLENNKYNITDLLNFALDKKPSDFKNAVDSILYDKINDAVEAKKLEMAQNLFNKPTNQDMEDEGNDNN
jgi:hypothetical protein